MSSEQMVHGPVSLRRVPVFALTAGAVLGYPVYDELNRKLLGQGMVLTEEFLGGLKRRGIYSVNIEERDVVRCQLAADVFPKAEPTEFTEATKPQDERLIDCLKCNLPLPLHVVQHPRPAPSWVCKGCNTMYIACLSSEHFEQFGEHIQPIAFKVDHAELEKPREELAEFIEELLPAPCPGEERRTAKRYDLSIPVVVQPVNSELCPEGNPTMMLTRNISTGGISMLHTHPISYKLLLVELPEVNGVNKQIVVEVMRCNHVKPFYEIGGRFIMKSA